MFNDLLHLKEILLQVLQGFRSSHSGKLPKVEVSLFFLVPGAASLILCLFADNHESLIADLLVVLSIYLGFLITMLVPFFNLIDRTENAPGATNPRDPHRSKRLQLYRVLYSQIAFAILLSVSALVSLVLAKTLGKALSDWPLTLFQEIKAGSLLLNALRFVGYYCVALGALNLIKILIAANSLIASDLPEN